MHGDEGHAWVHRQTSDPELSALIGIGGGKSPAAPVVGVKALMLALLEDAIRAYLGPVDRNHEEAALWIANSRRGWVFAFPVVCETLGLEPSAVRVALRRLHARSARALVASRSRPNARRHAGLRAASF